MSLFLLEQKQMIQGRRPRMSDRVFMIVSYCVVAKFASNQFGSIHSHWVGSYIFCFP